MELKAKEEVNGEYYAGGVTKNRAGGSVYEHYVKLQKEIREKKEAQWRAEEEANMKGPHIDNTKFSIFEESAYLNRINEPYQSQLKSQPGDRSMSETSQFAYDVGI